MKHFFKKVWLLLKSRKANAQSKTSRFSEGLQYLYALLWCTSFIGALSIGIYWKQHHQDIKKYITETSTSIATSYPEELIVTISGGILSTNVKEPYIVDPLLFQKLTQNKSKENTKPPLHFLTIDTTASPEDYYSYSSFVLVTKTSIILPDKNNSLRIILLERAEKPRRIDKKTYDSLMKNINPVVLLLPKILNLSVILLLILGPFLFAGFSLLGYMLYLVLGTLILWLISAILHRRLTFGDIYRIGLHGLTLPIIVALFLRTIVQVNLPFLFSLIFLGWMTAVIVSIKPKKK